jgi:hypothetical protein
VAFLRYGRREDGTAYLREVEPGELENGIVGEPAPKEGRIATLRSTARRRRQPVRSRSTGSGDG